MTLTLMTTDDTRTDEARRSELPEWIQRHSRLVRHVIGKLIRDPWEQEDVVQEALLKLWKSADRYDPSRLSESSFVGMVAQRCAIDHHRRRSRRPESTELDEEGVMLEENDFECSDDRDEMVQVDRSLRKLPPVRSRVIRMAYLQGLTQQEIAAELKLALGTIKSHLRRGLRDLRADLTAAGRNAA